MKIGKYLHIRNLQFVYDNKEWCLQKEVKVTSFQCPHKLGWVSVETSHRPLGFRPTSSDFGSTSEVFVYISIGFCLVTLNCDLIVIQCFCFVLCLMIKETLHTY